MAQSPFEVWLGFQAPDVPPPSAQAVLDLAAQGNTLAFIARYRKEATGNLNEVQIQKVLTLKETWDQIIKRQAFIEKEIESQGKLSPELKTSIRTTFDLADLEDIYLPYKKKRKTKAQKAIEAGLQGLADQILAMGKSQAAYESLATAAQKFLNPEKEITSAEQALDGARDIIVDHLQLQVPIKHQIREEMREQGVLICEKTSDAKPKSKFESYFAFKEKITSLLLPQNSHRYLAIRRGMNEKELKSDLEGPSQQWTHALEKLACPSPIHAEIGTYLKDCASQALKNYILPSIETEMHALLKEKADEAAIRIFSENVRKVLLAAPLGPKSVFAVDPGIRTGCKVAILDKTGKFLAHFVFNLLSEEEKKQASILIPEVLRNANIEAIAVGNGTASRETLQYIRELLKEKELTQIPLVSVNESGASIYSASEIAREEFPDLDVTVRGAISIGRRLQDPLSELVKVDPKSIGVGQYQHDVNAVSLKKQLEFVVDSCVNNVGVDLNTASRYLLSRVAGIGEGLAKNIVDFREKNGLFKSRAKLLDVPRLSQKTYEQAAGFLRIRDATNPLDNTGVHPEKYPIIETFASEQGVAVAALTGAGVSLLKNSDSLKEKLGPFTFNDIIEELEKPGRDPRQSFELFQFKEDVHEVSDLKPGMKLPGIVTNVTQFGAFVDVGVHQDGLVHISEISDTFISDPTQKLSPGDTVMATVLEVDVERKRISLSLRSTPKGERKPPERKHADRPRREPREPGKARALAPRTEPAPPPRPMPSGKKGPVKAKIAPPPNNPFAALAQMKEKLKR